MDIHKTHHHLHHHHQQKIVKSKRNIRGSRGRSSSKDAPKVVYISTPMKVKTSASKFRAIVQELTGRESDVVRIMETSGGRDTWNMIPDHNHNQYDGDYGDNQGISTNDLHHERVIGFTPQIVMDPDSVSGSSPSSSEEMINPFDGVFVRGQEGFGQFDANLLYDQFCHQLDVLGSY